MTAPAKPVDLAVARQLAHVNDVLDMPGTAVTVRAMADEIEALRETVRVLQDAIRRELDDNDLEACGPRPDLRALLP